MMNNVWLDELKGGINLKNCLAVIGGRWRMYQKEVVDLG